MIAFFQQVWAWLNSHAAVIAGVLTPANLVLVGTNLWQILRQKKAISANTNSGRELKASLAEIKALREDMNEIKFAMTAQNEAIAEIKDEQAQSNIKLNCVLEVQGQAYSVSMPNTKTLDVINGIISEGKYAEAHSRKAIVDEVAELREQMEKLTSATKESEKKVKRIAGMAEKKEEAVSGVRYD